MAAKPGTVPTWATDTNYPAGANPWNATPIKVAPSAGVRAAGYTPNTEAGAQHDNYDRNLYGLWITYLDDLHNSTDFLNKGYVWTGDHTFNGTTGITVNNTVFCSDVIVDTGNVTASAGNLVATAGDVRAGGDFEYVSPLTKNIVIALSSFRPESGTDWVLNSDPGGAHSWQCAGAEKGLIASVRLPADAVVLNLAVGVDPDAAPAAQAMKLQLWRARHDFVDPPSSAAWTQLGSTRSASGTGAQFIQETTDVSVTSTTDEFIIRVISSDASTALNPDKFLSCLLTFSDPGPRNF